ncbi:hypothetical protein Hypma_007562 [Hypsizygus marmoreus]|uniref:RlpA-like protein double-psi beta-barrel domain-containing protein n=1 Tax=Hypsizygus marmoreus TaxID=39966 RepID=A0A369JVS4_HYPMA|nr:hypothetical protein Hypma_007562 [Hypsizygus marmoreus]
MQSSFGLYTLFIACFALAFSAVGIAVPVESSSSLTKRDLTGKATWFNVGLGSCGLTNVDSDYIVALSPAQGSHCNQQIRITDETTGVSATATVRDTCPGCGADDLDLSPSLFSHFESLDKGTFQVNWSFI